MGDGHQSIHRGLYIYMYIGRIPIIGWRTIPDMTIFYHGMLFLKLSSFHVYLEDMYVCPGNFAARLWKGERNPLTTNF